MSGIPAPAVVSLSALPIVAEVAESIGDDPLMRVRFGNVLVLVLPAEHAEALVDAVMDAEANVGATVSW